LASNPQASHFVAVVALVRGSEAPPLTPSVRRNKIKRLSVLLATFLKNYLY